jgi:hypothetical protein
MSSKNDYLKDLKVIQSILRGSSTNQVKTEILHYSKLARPYWVPKRVVQDLNLHADRICDLIGGIPYVSEKNTWPIDTKTKEHLQPIIQLRLEKAGRLLKCNIGKGLLQVFGYSTDVYGELRFQHRVISPDDLDDPVEGSAPEIIARSINFDESTRENPKILWRGAGEMFMGDFSFVNLSGDESMVLDVDERLIDQESREKAARLIDLNESYEILDRLRSTPYFGTYLGGYGGDTGSAGSFLKIDPVDGFLLIRTGSTEDDAHVGVSVHYGKNGEVFFDIEGRYL